MRFRTHNVFFQEESVSDRSTTLWIAFYTEGLSMSGKPIEEQSIGGSESALWFMANALAARGHRVSVFCACTEPGVYNGVWWYHFRDFPALARAKEWDVLIVSRFYPVLATALRTKMNWLWLHDMPTDVERMAAYLFQTTQVIALSDFHRAAYVERMPSLASLFWRSRNGVDLDLIDRCATATQRSQKRFIYASRPERGLEYLLTVVWPKIVERIPDAELVICGYDVSSINIPQALQDLYARCMMLIRRAPGHVVYHGALTKAEYYALLSTCTAMIYPTAFPEIHCINATEALAAGVPIVTTDNFALRETVPYHKIPGPPLDERYGELFVEQVVRIAHDRLYAERLRRQGREYVQRHYQWAQIAAEWEARMWELFEERARTCGRKIVEQLLFHDDCIAARTCAIECGYSDIVAEIAEQLAQHHTDPDMYMRGLWSTETASLRPLSVRERNMIDMLPPPIDGGSLRVLDIGCGDGAILCALAKERADIAEAVGVDFSPQIVDLAQRIATNAGLSDRVKFVCTDFRAYTPEHRFDIVIAGEVLEHQIDYRAFIDACEACCLPGGKIVFSVPSGPVEADSKHVKQYIRAHVHHFEERDLHEIFGGKRDVRIFYLPMSVSPAGALLGWWIVSYTNDPRRPTGQIDYQRKFLTTVPRETIAACIIARNEEDNVLRAIKSLVGVVDEIWVWDCGSSDGTATLAARLSGLYWPRVYVRRLDPDPDRDGIGNFAAWRNQSIAETECDWVYWQDCDEVLVGYRNLRKYATGVSPFNAYVILQHHLQLLAPDPLPPDRPQRLFRNHRGYRFVGCIHEQPSVSPDKDDEIQPALVLPDVHIAHFGYLTQEQVRKKCFERNLPILLKDRRMYPNRVVGPLLVMRDYINLAQIFCEAAGGRPTEQVVQYLRNAIAIYHEHFADPRGKYHEYARKYYQAAVRWLGVNGIPARPEWGVPFEIHIALGGGVGGFQGKLEPESYWFASEEEFLNFLHHQGEQAVAKLHEVQNAIRESIGCYQLASST